MKKLLCLFLAMAMLTGCGKGNETPMEEIVEVPTEELLVEEEPQLSIYEEDAMYLVELIENTHPCFTLDDIPDDYIVKKENYLKSSKSIEDIEQFYNESAKYLCALKDGHTSLYSQEVIDQHFLQVSWYSDGKELYLCDEEGKPSNIKVLQIGGIDVQQIFDVISSYKALENDSAIKRAYRTSTKRAHYLQMAGVICDFDDCLLLTLDNGKTMEADWTMDESISATYEEARYQQNISWEMLGDVFYIDQNLCSIDDPNLEPTCSALKTALSDGVTKVIYDVRGNTGGNSAACYSILESMGMIPPTMGSIIRISELAKETYPSMYGTYRGTPTITGSTGSAIISKKNDEVKLIVLSDETTYSSANMLCAWVQDGKLCQIIGQGSSNSPSAYGDILYFKLPYTGLEGQVSHKRFTRADSTADQKQLHPDVEVPYGTDALSVALEMLAK